MYKKGGRKDPSRKAKRKMHFLYNNRTNGGWFSRLENKIGYKILNWQKRHVPQNIYVL